ncbi:autotransporter outer membrane beta-barrel domain-containing protein [Citrobacter youngae]|nr:autotransporter outer membrane beta-barrel domain-containing protein [Citrobacter youngae]
MNNHRKKIISLLITSAITTSSSIVHASTVIDNDIISVENAWGIFNKKSQYEINNTQIDVVVTASGNVSASHGILVNASPSENINATTTIVRDSVITSEGSGAYLVGGYSQFDNTRIQSTGNYGIVTKGGNIDILNGSSIEGKNNAYGLYLTKGYDGTYVENTVTIDDSSINSEAESAIVVGNGATAHISINNNSTVTSGVNKLLNAVDNSVVDFNLNGSSANGSMTASDTAIVNVTLAEASSLTGSAQNINSINIDSSSSWTVLTDSDVNDLKNEGIVTLSDRENIGSTLTIHNNYKGIDGTIIFNSQLAGDDSVIDKLVIEGNSEGSTKVIVNNIGGQGAQTIEGIELIHVDGQADGTFTQSGRIVAGAYDYSLVRGDENSNNWYLTRLAP